MSDLKSATLRGWMRRSVCALLLACGAGIGVNAHAQCNFDVDNNGKIDALTDGLMILRAGFGITGASLTQGALGAGATRTDPVAILAFINSNKT